MLPDRLPAVARSLLLLLAFAGTTGWLAAQDQSGPTINSCDGRQFFCLSEAKFELCATINIPTGFSDPIESFTIDWGDGKISDPIKYTADAFNRSHDYDLRTFYESCRYESGDIIVTLRTKLVDSDELLRNAFFLNLRKPPEADFGNNFPTTVCAGEVIGFTNATCPADNLTSTWDWGDGSPTTETSFHTFETPGEYTVRLSTENSCGSDATSRKITVIDQPVARALPDSGIVEGFADPYRVCFDRSATVRLDGSGSTGIDRAAWSSFPTTGIRFENAGRRNTRVTFTEAGTYTLTLTGSNNNCATPTETSFEVEVVAATVLTLQPQSDACISLDYCPVPFVPEATYTLNGEPFSACSQTLTEGTYVVEAFLANEICGDATKRDTFVVTAQASATIAASDTTLCDQDAAFPLTASPAGGQWTLDGLPFDGTIDPGAIAPGRHTVAYGNEPCLRDASIEVVILNSGVTVPDDTEVCIDGGPVPFLALPAGGTYSGTAITEEGVFDPAAAGLGTFTITYARQAGELETCGSVDSFRVTVTELAVDFTTESCAGNEVCLAIAGEADYEQISWEFGDGTTASATRTPCHTFPGPGEYAVTVTVTRGPCTATSVRRINIAPAPRAQFALRYDPARCADLLVEIDNRSSGDQLTYDWRLNGEPFDSVGDPAALTLMARTQDTSYTVELTVGNGCSSDTYRETVVVRPLPSATFGTDQNSYCSGDTIQVSNNAFGQPTSFVWTLNGEVVGRDSVPPLLVYETETGDSIEICQTTTNSCGTDTQCRRIAITPTTVTAFFNTDPVTLCRDDTIRLVNFATPGVPVRYDFGNGNGSTEPNPTVVYGAVGSYTISQRAFGCGSDRYEKEVTVVDRPTAAFTAPAVICPGQPVTFTNTSTGELGSVWDFGDGGGVVTEESPTYRFAAAGTYEVCLTVTALTPDGCDHTVCQTVTVSLAPVAELVAADSSCLGTPLRVSSGAVGEGLTCSYDFGDGGVATDCAVAYTYPQAGDYRLVQTVTDVRGCSDTAATVVTVWPVPAADFTFSGGRCDPEAVSFTNTSAGAVGYRWDFGDGNTSSLAEPVHRYAAAGAYTVRLTASNGNCTTVLEQQVRVNARPAARIAVAADQLCLGQVAELSDASVGEVASRSWDLGDGSVAFGERVSHPYAAAGTYAVRLVVTTAAGCTDTTVRELRVVPPAELRLAQSEEIVCAGEATAALGTTVTSGLAPYSFAWSDGAVTPDRGALAAGRYTLTLTDANGCTDIDSLQITEPPALAVAPEIEPVTCPGGEDGRIVSGVTGGTPGYRLAWTDGGQKVSTRSGVTAGTYTLEVTDVAGCRASFDYVVAEPEPIGVVLDVRPITCFGEADGVVSIDSLGGGTAPYTVLLTGPGYQEAGSSVSRFDRLDPGTYLLEVTDANACTESYDITVLEPDRVQLDILIDSIRLDLGDTVTLATRYNANAPTFTWSPAAGLSCTDCAAPRAQPFQSTGYLAEITDRNGCRATDRVWVEVDVSREVYLPNTFTPNGDGRNDVFRLRSHLPQGIERVVSFEIRDRWGSLVFSRTDLPPNDPGFGWDGDFRGQPATGGQYVYRAVVRFVDGFEKTLQGGITLIR